MIINVDTNLINTIEKMSKEEKELFKMFLDKICIGIKEGKHIIYFSKRDIFKLLKYEFLTEEHKKWLNILSTKIMIHYGSFDNLIKQIEPSDVVIISYNKFKIEQNNDCFYRYIDYKEFLDSETFMTTTIIIEHIKNDGNIYKNFFPYFYKKIKKLPFDVFLNKEMGGGNPIGDVLEEKCNEKYLNFSLFIIDSDKISPKKPGKGITAKTISKKFNKCKNYNKLKIGLYILEVRELENLIPLIFLQEYCEQFYQNYKLLLELDNQLVYYMDIKNGIFCFKRNNKQEFSIVSFSYEIHDEKIYTISQCDIKNCDDKRNYFCNLLKQAKIDFFSNKSKCEKLLKTFYDRYENSLEELFEIISNKCDYDIIKENWKVLGKLIYSWGVGFGKAKIY